MGGDNNNRFTMIIFVKHHPRLFSWYVDVACQGIYGHKGCCLTRVRTTWRSWDFCRRAQFAIPSSFRSFGGSSDHAVVKPELNDLNVADGIK